MLLISRLSMIAPNNVHYDCVRCSGILLTYPTSLWNSESCANMSDLEFDDIKPFIIVAIIVLNLTLNSLVIAVIVKHQQLREDRTRLFMLSLPLSDLANGCLTMLISAVVCSKI